mmetsp:Transcript_110120/g.275782  ORF Transcript_110120/g.275782 Transcript_110120/m.275782 type:complete len:200 (-) Transcript_110120:210-809(-)
MSLPPDATSRESCPAAAVASFVVGARGGTVASSALVALSVTSPATLGAELLTAPPRPALASRPACKAAAFSSSNVRVRSRVRLKSSFKLAHIISDRLNSRVNALFASRKRRTSSCMLALTATFSRRSTCNSWAASSNDRPAKWSRRSSGRCARYASIARCNAKRGINAVDGSSKPVVGDVMICLCCRRSRNHRSMYSRS